MRCQHCVRQCARDFPLAPRTRRHASPHLRPAPCCTGLTSELGDTGPGRRTCVSPQRRTRSCTHPSFPACTLLNCPPPGPGARRARFDRPYCHTLGAGCPCQALTIHQARFRQGVEGFASTVWDSSIVLAKFIERRHREEQGAWAGARCLDLSAGCGLVAVVLAALGASVVATDLQANLPLLRKNCDANGAGAAGGWELAVELAGWGLG